MSLQSKKYHKLMRSCDKHDENRKVSYVEIERAILDGIKTGSMNVMYTLTHKHVESLTNFGYKVKLVEELENIDKNEYLISWDHFYE